MRRQRVIARMLFLAGTVLFSGVAVLGFTGVAYSWQTTGQLTVVKTDGVGVPLVGAGFTLFTVGKDGTPGTATAWTCLISKLTGGVAECSTSDQVTPGTYWVVETTVPPGYSAGAPQKVTIEKMLVTTVTFKDAPLPGSVVITKTSAGRPLAGAGFTLYVDNHGVAGGSTGKSCQNTVIAGGQATCTITGVPAGMYWLEETTVPAGYIAGSPREISVSAGLDTAVTFVDDPAPPKGTTTTTAPPKGTTTTVLPPPKGTTTTVQPPPKGTTTTRPPTGPSGGTTTTVARPAGGTPTTNIPVIGPMTPISGVTTVQTGLAFAGSKLLVITLGTLGLAMIAVAGVLRRKAGPAIGRENGESGDEA